jgi:hypothetical protein
MKKKVVASKKYDERDTNTRLHEDIVLELIISGIRIIVLSIIIIILVIYFSKKPVQVISYADYTINIVTVSDIYIEDKKFYMQLYDKSTWKFYTIEIDKQKFMKYKINDTTKLKIYNKTGRVSLYEN